MRMRRGKNRDGVGVAKWAARDGHPAFGVGIGIGIGIESLLPNLSSSAYRRFRPNITAAPSRASTATPGSGTMGAMLNP